MRSPYKKIVGLSERGSALLNVVAVSAVLVTLSVVMEQNLATKLKVSKRTQVSSYRDQISQKIDNSLRNTYAMQVTSWPNRGNDALSKCVWENATNAKDCKACTLAEIQSTAKSSSPGTCWSQFKLYEDSSGAPNDIDPSDDSLIADYGDMMYNREGVPGCDPQDGDKNCVFKTEMQFAAYCPRTLSDNGTFIENISCDQAQYILVRHKVYDGRENSQIENDIFLGQSPPESEFTDAGHATRILISSIIGSDECPTGSIGYGFGANAAGYIKGTEFIGVSNQNEDSKGEMACKCHWESSNLITELGKKQLRTKIKFNSRGQPVNCNDLYTTFKQTIKLEPANRCDSDERFVGYRNSGSQSGYTRKSDCLPKSYTAGNRNQQIASTDDWNKCYKGDTNSSEKLNDSQARVIYLDVVDCWLDKDKNVVCDEPQSACGYRKFSER